MYTQKYSNFRTTSSVKYLEKKTLKPIIDDYDGQFVILESAIGNMIIVRWLDFHT